MTEQKLLDLEDFACLAEAARETDRDLGRARIYAECLAEQIEPLCSAAALSEKLRAAYSGLRDGLMEVATLARELERKYHYLSVWDEFHPDVNYSYSNEDIVEGAKRTITRINSVEQPLSRTMDGLIQGLRDAGHPLHGWEDAEVEFKIMLLLESSPERQCYEQLIEPMYFHMTPGFSEFAKHAGEARLLGDGDNWNDHRDTDHPLHDVHMGYLAHALLDETKLPWQLLGRVREIELDVEIHASRTFRIATEPDRPAT